MRFFLLLALLATVGCESSTRPGPANQLTGLVTVPGGDPARGVTVMAANEAGQEGSGLTDSDGRYHIDNPPEGKLSFRISLMYPPPPPGMKAPPPPPGATPVPTKYRSPNNGLSFEFTGGNQKYDIVLMP